MENNKLLKDIYKSVKGQQQDKINTVILYQLHQIQAVLSTAYKIQKLTNLRGDQADMEKIYAGCENELNSLIQSHNIQNLLETLDKTDG